MAPSAFWHLRYLLAAALASCAIPGHSKCVPSPEFIEELAVTGCTLPDELIDQAIERFPQHMRGAYLPGYAEHIKRTKGVVLSVLVSRQCQVPRGPYGQITGRCTWQPANTSSRYFWFTGDPQACSEFSANPTRTMLVTTPCCDTEPPGDIQCLIRVRQALPLPKWATEVLPKQRAQ